MKWWQQKDQSREVHAMRGFALPTVLIAGLLLLILGASSMQAVASTTRAINDQYWNTLAEQAKESGAKYVENCLRNSADAVDPTAPWTAANVPDENKPITQSTDCIGTAIGGGPTELADVPASGNMPHWKTTFSVSYPKLDATTGRKISRVVGTLQILGASNTVTRTYSSSSTIVINVSSVSGIGIYGAKVAYAQGHVCSLLSNNQIYCSGYGANGEVGNGAGTTTNAVPAKMTVLSPSTGYTDIAVYSAHDGSSSGGVNNSTRGITCGLGTDSQVYCAGYAPTGALGKGNFGQSNNVAKFTLPAGLTATGAPTIGGVTGATARMTSCVIASDGGVYCAGSNNSGQLGVGTTTDKHTPDIKFVDAGGLLNSDKAVKVVALSDSASTCVLTVSGKLYCAGDNSQGQFGTGSTAATVSTPIQAFASITDPIIDVGTGKFRTCVLTAKNLLYCAGQITTAGVVSSSPVIFGNTSTYVRDFSVGLRSICIVDSSYAAKCVSDNEGGQLCNGSSSIVTPNMAAPFTIPSSCYSSLPNAANLRIVRVLAGDKRICLYFNVPGSESRSGTMSCAGVNSYGQFGIGSSSSAVTNFNSAFAMPSGVTIRMPYINRGPALVDRSNSPTMSETPGFGSAGMPITCVMASDGFPYCAGRNDFGQITNSPAPSTTAPGNQVMAPQKQNYVTF